MALPYSAARIIIVFISPVVGDVVELLALLPMISCRFFVHSLPRIISNPLVIKGTRGHRVRCDNVDRNLGGTSGLVSALHKRPPYRCPLMDTLLQRENICLCQN